MTDEHAAPTREVGFDVIIELHGAPGRKFVSPRLAAALQDVYDIASNSMDFGSGFLDTDEVDNLRELGKAIGAQPLHYNCDGFYNSGDEKGGYRVTRPDPEHPGQLKSVRLETRPCSCGALGDKGPIVDGEVVEDRTGIQSATRAIES